MTQVKGNPVMKAKVVTGPTPNQKLHTWIATKQLNGTYPLVNKPNGKAVVLRDTNTERGDAILKRVRDKIAANNRQIY